MKKRVEKPKAKLAKPEAAKNETARKAPVLVTSPHDALHSLLRGAHTHKVCR